MEEGPIDLEDDASEEEMRRTRIQNNQAAIHLLRSWDDPTDDDEQIKALDELKAAIDANRIGPRKHFS